MSVSLPMGFLTLDTTVLERKTLADNLLDLFRSLTETKGQILHSISAGPWHFAQLLASVLIVIRRLSIGCVPIWRCKTLTVERCGALGLGHSCG